MGNVGIGAKSGFAAICEINALIGSVVIIVVVMPCTDPLNGGLLLNSTEEPGVDRPAADVFTSCAKE